MSEPRRILNCLPSPTPERDWGMDAALTSGALCFRRRPHNAEPLPASVDLRAEWWAVGDQESTGSCVGWATADSVVRWHMVKASKIGGDQLLSVRYVWMAAKECDEFTSRPTSFLECEGTSLKSALDVCRKYGVVLDDDLPFGKARLYDGETSEFYALASRLKINAYFNLGREPNDWRAWLAHNGPILTRLDVDEAWDKATETHGVLETYQHPGQGGHAVALVGYTPQSFIVRNSWGETWGDAGYAYASLEYAGVAFTEAYGVTVE